MALLFFTAAAAEELPKGNVMLAKSQPNIILIWDATPAIADLVAAKRKPEDAMRLLESDAVDILASRARGLSAESMSIRVVYQQTASVNPAYASATLQGTEKLLTIAASRADVEKSQNAWKEQLANGTIPKGLTITITGKYPGT